MLGNKDAMATIAVKDLAKARKFYEGKLDLKVADTEGSEVVAYTSGKARIMVYVSQYAGTNKATAATWVVGEGVDKVVEDLKAKGVTFEHYDMPDTTRKGDVHISGDVKVAWFKDPDGNILSIVNG